MARIAVFGDVHGNLPALERFVAATRREVDSYVCLGDVVNYGPWNDECLEVVHSLPGVVFVEGNHERLFLGSESVKEASPLVRRFLACSRPSFSRPDLITGLPREYRLDDVTFTHTIEDRRVYPDTVIDVPGKWVIGHSHYLFRTEMSDGWIVNVGSIGQNRQQIDAMEYAIYETRAQSFELRKEPWDVDSIIDEMVRRGYPEECIGYYATKQRAYAIG